ncbi:protein YLS3 [Canna indica]|uniref:Protein YLS3 n=1 Tax=Canna indica TaxID=4628 RepID=A0AAQ3JL76_9LILI|nr:protein YLS3 [Canna indica]
MIVLYLLLGEQLCTASNLKGSGSSLRLVEQMKTSTVATSPEFAAVAVSLTLLMAVISHADPSPIADMASCGGRLLLLSPCTAFVQGAAPDPTDACCDSIDNLYRDEPRCVCPVLDRTLSLPVNHSLVLRLPLLCRLNLTDDSCSESPAFASPPPLRMNNVLFGMNQGGKLRVGEASVLAFTAGATVLLVLDKH